MSEEIQTIKPDSQEAWLELRARDITSTEAAALFGLSPYTTQFELWHRKRSGDVVAFQENDRMKWGNRFEDSIAQGIAEDEGLVIRRMKEYSRIPSLRLGASFDFRIQSHYKPEMIDDVNPSDSPEDGLLEIKNVDALQFREKWVVEGDSIEAPPHIEIQVQHQLLVSGLSHALIGGMIGGNRVVIIKRSRDEKIISAIQTKAAAFWKSIDERVEPKPDFTLDAEFIASLYGFAEPGKVVDASEDHDIAALVASYKLASEAQSAAEKKKEAAKAELLTKIGDAEKVMGPGWSISAGMIGPADIAYTRKAYRNFRVNVSKKKVQEVA